MPRKAKTLVERFEAKVDRTSTPDGCHEWVGLPDADGYGRMRYGGKTRKAHRLAWELVHGPIPAGMCACHRCDRPACVRVDHLFLGTPADNNADRDAKGRGADRRGDRGGNAKLTNQQAAEILDAYKTGEQSHADLATEYNVSRATVSLLLAGKTWANIPR